MSGVRRLRERWGALLFVWLWQLAAATLLCAPLVTAIAGTGVARHPRGDAVLFDPGGMLLIETGRLGADALASALQTSVLELFLLATVGLVPLAALLVALCRDARLRLGPWLGEAIGHFPVFVLISGVAWLGRVLVLVVTVVIWASLDDTVHAAFSERTADLVLLASAGVGVFLIAVIGISADLARAAAVRHEVGGFFALRTGVSAFFAHPLASLIGWLIPAVWSIAVVALAALIVGALRIEAAGSWRTLLAFLTHQAAILGLIALRALWLRRSLELVDQDPRPISSADVDQAVAPMV